MGYREVIQKCETLYHDLDLNYVKQWKAKTGRKAVGYMPTYVPREIIHAAGMLPVGIMGGGDSIEIIRGDAYFQSYICRIPRSTIELGVSGRLDCLDGMMFPAICDVIRNLSGMWQILFPHKYIRYMDFPQDYNQAGRDFWRHDMELLKSELEKLGGQPVTDAAFKKSIELYNENRKWLEKLYSMRADAPNKVMTYETYLLLRASNIVDVVEHTALLKEYCSDIMSADRPLRDNVRVVVSGAFCEQPPLSLIRALESSGCYIVDDDWVVAARYNLKNISTEGNPLHNIADSYLKDTVSTASRYEEGHEKGKFLLSQVRSRRAEGVVFAAASFCDPALLERPMLQDVLAREGIPYTGFKYAENTGQIQVIKEETGTFADSIKLWGATT